MSLWSVSVESTAARRLLDEFGGRLYTLFDFNKIVTVVAIVTKLIKKKKGFDIEVKNKLLAENLCFVI